jgi:hypothetical protein
LSGERQGSSGGRPQAHTRWSTAQTGLRVGVGQPERERGFKGLATVTGPIKTKTGLGITSSGRPRGEWSAELAPEGRPRRAGDVA